MTGSARRVPLATTWVDCRPGPMLSQRNRCGCNHPGIRGSSVAASHVYQSVGTDPLAEIFDAEVVPLLKAAPGVRPVAVFEEMMRRHPELPPGVRRTIERRIRGWRGPSMQVLRSAGPGRGSIAGSSWAPRATTPTSARAVRASTSTRMHSSRASSQRRRARGSSIS